ncbi:Cytochrome c [Tistlia consotensis]|uniref:Cytochrome c n=2 Tax=Tistlia TaxID=1321364 RepID=A0A1Y6CX09_9PROT|nr:Cytochrome c [Tistlia consotensis USBA 355]SNS21988.1 Cytochrome c [Tistlia consotensis]
MTSLTNRRLRRSCALLGTAALVSFAAVALLAGAPPQGPALAAQAATMPGEPNLELPKLDPRAGRRLFASKGCVVCHSVNGVGGTDAPRLDADTMPPHMNPFDLAARMWRGAPAMIMMQQEELGGQIEFTGQQLADITAFLHDRTQQAQFSLSDVPQAVRALMDDDDAKGEKDRDESRSGARGGMMGGGSMGGGMMGSPRN